MVTAARTQTLLSTPTLAPPMPQVIHPDGSGSQAVAHRTAGGTYAIQAEVNGAKLPMLFDTGASYVALRAEDAEKAGIDPLRLAYSFTMSTANGRAAAAPVVLQSLTVGQITRRNVPAIVSKPGQLGVSLLGQSFMSRIAGYTLQGDHLILQGE